MNKVTTIALLLLASGAAIGQSSDQDELAQLAGEPEPRNLTSTMAEMPVRSAAYFKPAEAFRQQLLTEVHYPKAARELGLEGTVRVRVWLQPDGHVAKATILHSAGRLLDQAVLAALYQGKASPGTAIELSRQPIDYPITFKQD